MGISAKVICHSKAPNGEELITMEVEFHRFILAEINTHRCLSRNYQSSRAVPVEKMIEQVKTDPAIPVHWGKNQRGMVADGVTEEMVELYDYFGGVYECETTGEQAWRVASRQAAMIAEAFNDAGYHKQIVNRLLEPFIWTKGVITATKVGWESVFKLRCSPMAQPEFQALAYKIKEAIEESSPTELYYGDYHLPYVKSYSSDVNVVEEAIKISTSCCGQVSYRTLDDSLEKALRIYDLLNLPEDGIYKEDPAHFSPAEHIAKVENWTIIEDSGNFHSSTFWQYRKALEVGLEKEFIGD